METAWLAHPLAQLVKLQQNIASLAHLIITTLKIILVTLVLILAQLVHQLHIVNHAKLDTICNLILIHVPNVRPHAQFVKLQEIQIVRNVRLAIIWIPPFANPVFPHAKPVPHSLVA